MARVAHLFDQKQVGWKLVEGKRRFVTSDDLVIKPASTANTHLLLQTISSGGIDRSFEEIEVCVGWAEVSKYCFLGVSKYFKLQSTFVWTNLKKCIVSCNFHFDLCFVLEIGRIYAEGLFFVQDYIH